MTDDNTIDITRRLPPVEVRKPWRRKMPSYHAENLNALKDRHQSVRRLIKELESIHTYFPDKAEYAAECISDALVLLKCAEEKLFGTIPAEEYMSPRELKEFGLV